MTFHLHSAVFSNCQNVDQLHSGHVLLRH